MDNLQNEIILAAISEFKSKGLKFKMDDIAVKLSISKKTIYTVFDSKEMLIDGIADYAYRGIKDKEQEIINSDLDIVEKIRQVIIALPDSYKEIDFRMLNELEDKYPKTYRKVVKNIETNWESTFALLDEGMKQGRIRHVNVFILKEVISGTIEHFISSQTLTEQQISYNEALDQMMDIIIKGLERR